jgi:arylsulfatase A-like enzyme
MEKEHKRLPSTGQPRKALRLSPVRQSVTQACAAAKSAGLILPLAAATWFGFAFVELLLGASIPGSAVRNHQLPFGARFLLLCYSLTTLSLFVFVISGSAIALRRLSPTFRRVRWLVHVMIGLTVWFILLLYAASWAMFWQTGNFLGGQGLLFLARNPIQVFHWVELDTALTVLAATLTATMAVVYLAPYWIARCRVITQQRLVRVWSLAMALSISGAFLGTVYSHWGERQYTRSGILYTKTRNDAAGPFPYAVTDLRRYFLSQSVQPETHEKFEVIQRPIVSMAQYLSWVDKQTIKNWNVILLVVESLRADQLHAYGGSREIMPTIDKLARDGRVFLNAYSQSSHTNYATLVPLSSHYPLRSTVEHVYPENPTYPRVLIYDVLKALGYHTAIFSSSNEHWAGMINYLNTGKLDRLFHAAEFNGPTYIMEGDFGLAAWAKQTKHAGSVDDRFTTDEAIRWIESLDRGPFFLYMNLQNSHVPYVVPRDFPRRFGPEKLDFKIRFGYFPQDKTAVVKDVYADSLAYIDTQINRLFDYLDRRGQWQNTLVVVTGDHGQAFYEHGFASHAGALFDEVMKVPLIFRAPGLQAGVDSRPAQHADMAPSILKLLGLPTHPSFQGVSLFQTAPVPNRTLYLVAQTPLAFQYGLVRSGFKLIYDDRQRQYSLYNLATDPEEKMDVAGSRPLIVKELANRLQAWRKLQIDYYADRVLQAREYPPILSD